MLRIAESRNRRVWMQLVLSANISFFFFSRSAVVMASDREVEAVRRCLELAQAAQDKSK